MEQFSDVCVVKKANIYFNGGVTSRTVLFSDGSKKTLGIMMPGQYEFDTSERELMEILGGTVEVLLPNAEDWKTCRVGDSFEVPAKAIFKLKLVDVVDYCCSYLGSDAL